MKNLALIASLSLLVALAVAPVRAADGGSVSGILVETMDGGGYTYALLDTGKEKVWVAAYPFKAAVGEKVTVASSMEMKDFDSPSLKRKFDRIYFASAVALGTNVPAASKLPAGHPPVGGKGPGKSHAMGGAHNMDASVGPGIDGTVTETMDVGAYTYVKVRAKDNKEVWAAASRFDVKVGDEVNVPEGQLMSDFHSAKLNRTFSEIYFVGSVTVKGKTAKPAAHP